MEQLHQTPKNETAWFELAKRALEPIGAKPVRLVEDPSPGTGGEYAHVRVEWVKPDGRTGTHMIVAGDENSIGPSVVVDGTTYWPFAIWGHY